LLTAAQLDGFRRHGVVFPIPVLSAQEAARFRGACDDLEIQLGGNPRTVEVRQMHLHLPWAYELAVAPRVLDAAEQVLGPDLLVWATELFAKRPGDPLFIAWHRDRTYMGFDTRKTVTAWIALAPSIPENGCLQVVLEPDRRGSTLGAQAAGGADPGVPPDRVTDVVLQAGEMSLHDNDVYHGSRPNQSTEKRVGFAIRFVTPDAAPLSGRPPVLLARGRAASDNFDIREPPSGASAEAALDGVRESARLHFDAMLLNLKRLRPRRPTTGLDRERKTSDGDR
jgi:hypothetical protein